ncbi:AAA family ATPase [Yinghuangia soli]|uniref:AAA family ATPase n=1 Tax=Yinghuangia soli TaxID=2908204 RepID=A0AA41U354_9ACTN|nr:AAA family ATPase [Yinghuangia soli]MCF2527744.1 AAA family ATPase [Yinghuangia soli]
MFVKRLRLAAGHPGGWPFTLAPIRQLGTGEGVALDRPITFLVGENGSGKSTLVEAIADAAKIGSFGGKAGTKYAPPGEPTLLGEYLDVDLTTAGLRMTSGPRRQRRGFFLRAETLFDLSRQVGGRPGYWSEDLEELSHGEGFLAVFDAMLREPGLYLFDEPEAALSFTSCLRLVGLMLDLADSGSQIVCATHSPILAATPGAEILELGEQGIERTEWRDLALVDHWARFMGRPDAYLRHIVP